MITAYEFYEKADPDNDNLGSIHYIQDIMVEFAKYHVEKALEKASEAVITAAFVEQSKGLLPGMNLPIRKYKVDKDSILNAYPLNNIK